jgi:hypothetical protein
LAVDVSDFAGAGLEDDGSENLRIAASAAGSGLTGGAGSALDLDWGTPTIGTIEPDDSATAGTSTNPARSDHQHAIATAAAGTIQPDDSAAEGSATSFARSDHTHAIVAAVAGTIEPDDGAAEGSATSFARSDHQHAIAAAAASTLTVSTSNAEGAATSFARSNHTHAITTSANPGAAASILASNASGNLTLQNVYVPDGGFVGVSSGVGWTFDNTGSELEATASLRIDGDLDFVGAQSITTTAGNLTLAPAGDLVLNPTGDDVLPDSGYDINLGSITKKYLTLHAAELWVQTLVAQDVLATIGGRIITAPTTMLATDLGSGAGDTTITVEHNNLANGDTVVLEADGNVEWMLVGSAASDNGDGTYDYTVTRDRDGSGRNAWYAGDAVVNTGAAGDGFIDQYSVSGVVADSTAGPTVVGNVRNSDTYNDYTEAWAIGNLNGLYGYSSDIYGVGLGKYSAADYLTVDPSNGVRFLDSDDTAQAQLTGSVWTIGEVAPSKSNVQIAAGAINLRTNTTTHIHLATDGSLWAGDTATTERLEWSSGSGLQIYNAGNNAILTIPTSGDAELVGTLDITSGKITAGNVTMLTSGILIDATSSIGVNTSYRFVDPADDVIAKFSAYYDAIGGSTGGALQVAESDDSHDTLLEIESSCPSGQESVLELTAINAGDTDVEIKMTNGSAVSTVEITNAGVVIGPSAGTVKDNALRVETDVLANNDLLAGGGIYAGDVTGTPGTGVIYAEDYMVAMGGIHVGGASDPGTDNAIIDGDGRIGGGLYVGGTGTDPDADDIWLDGDVRSAGGAYFGGTVASDDPDAGYVVATNGVSGWLPFSPKVTDPTSLTKAANDGNGIYTVSIDRAMTIDHWTQACKVSTTNDASNYWTLSLLEWDGTVIASINTSGESADTRLSLLSTSINHDLDPSTGGQEMIYVRIQATGSPGALALHGPAVYVL